MIKPDNYDNVNPKIYEIKEPVRFAPVPMTKQQYLESILTKGEIADIMRAIKDKRPIFVDGLPCATGKSSLVQFLKREYGADAYDVTDSNAVRIELNKRLDSIIHNVIYHLTDGKPLGKLQ